MDLFGCIETGNYPGRVIISDDPLRVKMLAAHHLENAVLMFEQDDILVWFGSYNGTAIALVSAGFNTGSVSEYLEDAKRLGVTELIYIGECISASSRFALRSVILADGGESGLLARAQKAGVKYSIPVAVQPVFTRGSITPDFKGLADEDTGGLYEQAEKLGIAALSILTVTKNTDTGEQMEEHERRSRLYNAARIAFETLTLI